MAYLVMLVCFAAVFFAVDRAGVGIQVVVGFLAASALTLGVTALVKSRRA
jgi:hypothetical protein